MLERDIEAKLLKALRILGCKALKYANHHDAGYPDRLVLTPRGTVFWVEVKQPRGSLRPIQRVRKQELEQMGFMVFVCKGDLDISCICEYAQSL